MADFWNKFWKEKDGHIVIWQWPNIWLIGWGVLTFISLVLSGTNSKVFMWGGEALLLVWCLLEIFKGVNYFRRLLGVLVLIYLIITLFRGLT